MSTMTREQAEAQAKKIVDQVVQQTRDAAIAGDEQLENYLRSMAFAIGSMIPAMADPRQLGSKIEMMIETMISGIEAGFKVAELPGTFVVVRRDL